MIEVDDVNLLEFYEDYMVAHNGIVYYCQFYPSDDFPDRKDKGIFVIHASDGVETLCSYWEANVIWRIK